MNKKAIRAFLAQRGETYADLGKVIGCTTSTISKKVNEHTGSGFTQPEIIMIKKHYNLTAKQIDQIFFEA